MKVIIESPLGAKTKEGFKENFRYLLWCCRAEYLIGNEAIASHLICPWFMNDHYEKERMDGINWSWVWGHDPHVFYTDNGISTGMRLGKEKLKKDNIDFIERSLKDRPDCWFAYENGEWPPHTEGFQLM